MARIDFDDILNTLVRQMRNTKSYDDIIDSYIQLKRTEDKISPAEETIIKDLFHKAAYDELVGYQNFVNVNKILTQHFLRDVNSSSFYTLNTETRVLEKVEQDAIKDMFEPKAFSHFKARKMKTVKIAYNPQSHNLYFNEPDSLFQYVNTYTPAEWNKNYFYQKVTPPVVKTIPALYENYLRNLVTTEESYQYCLTFLATAVQPCPRMQPFLTMIGSQGTGKGLFGQIASQLAGKQNYAEIICSDVQGAMKFNSQMENKRIMFLDELVVKNQDDQDALKKLINQEIEIEKKGVDRKVAKNYASCMAASNNLGAINPDATDRRYSFLDMRNVLLSTFVSKQYPELKSTSDYVNMILDPENIRQLGLYLLNYKIEPRRLESVIQSEYAKMLKTEALPAWAQVMLNEVAPKYAGQDILVNKVKEEISILSNSNAVLKMSSLKFKELEQKQKGFFETIRKRDSKDQRLLYIRFAKLKDQPKLSYEGKDDEQVDKHDRND